jgi:hypothetical protein
MSEEIEKFVTKDYLEVVIGRLENKIDRLENKIDAKFNNIDAKFNSQRLWIILVLAGVIGQIVNAWIIHLK